MHKWHATSCVLLPFCPSCCPGQLDIAWLDRAGRVSRSIRSVVTTDSGFPQDWQGKGGGRQLRSKAEVSDCNCGTVARVLQVAFSVHCVRFGKRYTANALCTTVIFPSKTPSRDKIREDSLRFCPSLFVSDRIKKSIIDCRRSIIHWVRVFLKCRIFLYSWLHQMSNIC